MKLSFIFLYHECQIGWHAIIKVWKRKSCKRFPIIYESTWSTLFGLSAFYLNNYIKMIKNENFVAIQWRMVNELWLHGNDLMVYAVINSFTNQDDDHYFHWSLQYLADWCNTSRTNIIRNIKNLVDKWLIEKKEIYQNNVKFCEYRCIPIDNGVIKMRTGCSQNDNGGVI